MHYVHRLTEQRLYQVVGAFVWGALFLIIVSLGILAFGKHLFDSRYTVVASFREGYGLRAGRPVTFLGIEIGQVRSVELAAEDRANVTLEIIGRYRDRVRETSMARVNKGGAIVGEPFVEITVGDPATSPIEDGATIATEEPYTLDELLAEAKPVVERVKNALLQVEDVTRDLGAALKSGKETLEHVSVASQRLPNLIADAEATAASLRVASAATARDLTEITKGVRGGAERLPALAESLDGSARDMKAITKTLRSSVERDVPSIVSSARETVDEVGVAVDGVKETFPMSVFMDRGREARAKKDEALPAPLRAEEVGVE